VARAASIPLTTATSVARTARPRGRTKIRQGAHPPRVAAASTSPGTAAPRALVASTSPRVHTPTLAARRALLADIALARAAPAARRALPADIALARAAPARARVQVARVVKHRLQVPPHAMLQLLGLKAVELLKVAELLKVLHPNQSSSQSARSARQTPTRSSATPFSWVGSRPTSLQISPPRLELHPVLSPSQMSSRAL
jgi:hypothetical protein